MLVLKKDNLIKLLGDELYGIELESVMLRDLENSYREQLEQDETVALAIVVPESVTRYMDEELNLKKMKRQPITVSSDKSIGDAGRQDGYGFGQGDRIASCA